MLITRELPSLRGTLLFAIYTLSCAAGSAGLFVPTPTPTVAPTAIPKPSATAREDLWQALCRSRIEAAIGPHQSFLDATVDVMGNPGGGRGVIVRTPGKISVAGVSGIQLNVRDATWYDLNAPAPSGDRLSLFRDRNGRSGFIASTASAAEDRAHWVAILQPALDDCLEMLP